MDIYEYRNSTSAEPQGLFPLDLLAELRRKGYLGPGSFIRENGREWVKVRDMGIPLSYPAAHMIRLKMQDYMGTTADALPYWLETSTRLLPEKSDRFEQKHRRHITRTL